MEYKIEVSLNPDDNKYFWVIFGRRKGTVGWTNQAFSWADNPVAAMNEAYDYYLKHLSGMDDEILKRFV